MSLFGFGAPKHTSFVLIDIDSSSIGGAVSYFNTSAPTPVLCYANRTPIDRREGEDTSTAMLRALQDKVRELIIQGGPALHRQTGTGHSDHILVRIGSVWQKTLIRREKVEESKSFTYTSALQREILKKNSVAPADYRIIKETVIATLLNGYSIDKPFGKKTHQVEVVIASSWIKTELLPMLQKIVRSAYHTHALTLTTPVTVVYEVFKKLFPHEKNYLALEITGESTDMSYVKNGILIKTASVELGVNDIIRHARDGMHGIKSTRGPMIDAVGNTAFSHSVESAEDTWIKKIETLFQEFASEQALPRTIFLIAPEGTREYLSRLLDTPTLRSLWLSDEPLRIIGIAPSHLLPFVTLGTEAQQDTTLGLFALYALSTIHTPLLKG